MIITLIYCISHSCLSLNKLPSERTVCNLHVSFRQESLCLWKKFGGKAKGTKTPVAYETIFVNVKETWSLGDEIQLGFWVWEQPLKVSSFSLCLCNKPKTSIRVMGLLYVKDIKLPHYNLSGNLSKWALVSPWLVFCPTLYHLGLFLSPSIGFDSCRLQPQTVMQSADSCVQ